MGEIADEHFSNMLWEYGNPYYMDRFPFADTPDFGGWKNYLISHQYDDANQRAQATELLEESHIRLDFSFKCRFCGGGITFINKKAFDQQGPHTCIANGSGKRSR